jgi:hypothetical protein
MPAMRCEDVRAELTAFLTGGSPPPDVAQHVATCASCRRAADAMRDTASLVASAPLEWAPPEGLEEHVMSMAELDEVARLVARVPLEHEPPDDLESRALARVGILPSPERSPWSRAAALLAPGLAAAAVVLGVLGVQWRNDAIDYQNEVESLRKGLGTGVPIRHASLFDAASNSRAEITLMGKRGEGADPASGSDRSGGYYLVLRAHNLPLTQPGYHYELWLIGDRGVLPSVGFPVTRSDEIDFRLPLGVDPRHYPILEVTLEPDGGTPDMDGTPVMQGHLETASVP